MNRSVQQVFKTVTDPFVGKLSFFKVYSGVLEASTALYNANMRKSEKLGALYILKGKKQIPVSELRAGDIGAVSKLQYTLTSHTLCKETAVNSISAYRNAWSRRLRFRSTAGQRRG